MRHAPRTKNGITGLQLKTLRANLGNVVSFENIKPLILIVVQMAWWTALLVTLMLHDKESATAIFRQYFEHCCAQADVMTLAEPVLATGNANGFGRCFSLGGLRD